MKIKNIKINAYGNLENKEINLEDNINIIHGENEAGKSTLLSYIVNTLYGISKTKDGREISDYEKYKPWNSTEFSGKLSYKLEDGEEYEIFRDFNKKNPKIYNSKLEDITANFDTDKKDGSKFFVEQTGIDKQTYLSTVVSMQQEVRLEEKDQNILIQRIANLASSGEDNVSYKKAVQKLQEKIRDEIGTNKTSQKPINIIEKEINDITRKIEEIKPYQNRKYEIDEQKEQTEEELKELEIQMKILKELKEGMQEEDGYEKEIDIKEKNRSQNVTKIKELKAEETNAEEEIKIPQMKISEIEKTIENNKKRQEEIEQNINGINEEINAIENQEATNSTETNKGLSKGGIIGIIISVILIILSLTVIKNNILLVLGVIGILLSAIVSKSKANKNAKLEEARRNQIINRKNEKIGQKRNLEDEKERITNDIKNEQTNLEQEQIKEKELNSNLSMIKGQIMLLDKNNEQLCNELEEISLKLDTLKQKKVEEIKAKYKENSIENLEELLEKDTLITEINNMEEKINNERLKLKGLEIEEKTILPEIDSLASLEERKELGQEKYKELKSEEEVINIAIDNLQEAYQEMKTTITPKFTNSLSNSIERISNGKYNRVTINDENGMIVENARGEYIEAGKLSTGTIDQLYLSLRLSMIDELTKEKLPIILDETFAYFDNERLANALKFINERLEGHQAIIFTCTNREKEILEKLGIKYNLIEL